MKKTKQLIRKAFSVSTNPGLIYVKRFSRNGINVRRFSMDGEVELDETIEDEELAKSGSEVLAEEIPAEEVVVFSDAAEGTDEVIAPVDGGDVTPIVESKEEDGFVEDTESSVSQNCNDSDAVADTIKQFSKRNRRF